MNNEQLKSKTNEIGIEHTKTWCKKMGLPIERIDISRLCTLAYINYAWALNVSEPISLDMARYRALESMGII